MNNFIYLFILENSKAELIRNHRKEVKESPPSTALLCINVFTSQLECLTKDNARNGDYLNGKCNEVWSKKMHCEFVVTEEVRN